MHRSDYAFAADIGGTHLRAGIVDRQHRGARELLQADPVPVLDGSNQRFQVPDAFCCGGTVLTGVGAHPTQQQGLRRARPQLALAQRHSLIEDQDHQHQVRGHVDMCEGA